MYVNLIDMGNVLNGIKKKIVREALRKQPTVEEVNDEFDDWMEQHCKPLLIFDNYDQFANFYSDSDLDFIRTLLRMNLMYTLRKQLW